MLTSHRKQAILAALKRDGQVVAKTLSEVFGVSEDTIRRDLRELAVDGLLQRVHGGALPSSPAAGDFVQRQQISTDAKSAIARKAATLIAPGQVVLFDGGTTCVELARHLPPSLQATVVTHSPSVAVALVDHPGIEVVLIGGRLFKHSIVTVGAAAIEAIGHIRADTYFMGVTGVHPTEGLSTGDLEEAYVKRALVARAAEVVVLASAEKLNAASPYVIAEATAATMLVVEGDTPEAVTDPFAALGIAILRA
ncbi:DeoR/GlpR family DNA-binding transcription regulator [Dyella caseinilytica]|uniref:DeoR/GlpR transcriptional regulator n=1 Tax=Dyella caseinilytica TaxID=1849581 RepID=A0ABX7GWF6_9GAMM|nr:DeoR/GlpR family DNA-binding transcription regulator [Dyella caseinilytica]QRN54817.1 DeoR/GlpR transcriptional regulator [Dyella caseinilytica]GFZ97104.1 DeoR family transcriptional regulator [Dyella caseinilytica]